MAIRKKAFSSGYISRNALEPGGILSSGMDIKKPIQFTGTHPLEKGDLPGIFRIQV